MEENTVNCACDDDAACKKSVPSPGGRAVYRADFPVIRRLLSCTRRAVDEYGMIEEGDRIAVGLSGGKDSIALLCALINLSVFYPKHFELVAVTADMSFEDIGRPAMDFSPVREFCESRGVPFRLVKTHLAKIIFETRKESNPCSLCAKMRRGILHDAAIEAGCNKIALGHHYDDAVETFMLNLFHEGRLGSFSPVTYLDRKKITLIRPLIYAPEKDIRYFLAHNELPVVPSSCPEDGHTEREEMKQLLAQLDRKYKGLKHRIFGSLQSAGIDGYAPRRYANAVKEARRAEKEAAAAGMPSEEAHLQDPAVGMPGAEMHTQNLNIDLHGAEAQVQTVPDTE